MLWVDVDGYEGPDRRRIQRWRLIERRQVNRARRPPALVTRLRQLRVKALHVKSREDRAAFIASARAASLLAEVHGRYQEAGSLNYLAAHVGTMPLTVNLSDWLDREIDALIQRASAQVL